MTEVQCRRFPRTRFVKMNSNLDEFHFVSRYRASVIPRCFCVAQEKHKPHLSCFTCK